MRIFNLGISEIILIVILALIILGPGNMVKTAREIGAFIRKVTKSPYWQEIWATKRELTEIPRMLAKEADLDATLKDLNNETRNIHSSVASTMSDFIKEVDEPLKEVDKELKAEPVIEVTLPVPPQQTIEPKNSQEVAQTSETEAPTTSKTDTAES